MRRTAVAALRYRKVLRFTSRSPCDMERAGYRTSRRPDIGLMRWRGELIPCAFVWHDPGITPCCKSRPVIDRRSDIGARQQGDPRGFRCAVDTAVSPRRALTPTACDGTETLGRGRRGNGAGGPDAPDV